MAFVWANNASSTVSGTVAAGDGYIVLAPNTGAAFPSPAAGDQFAVTIYDQLTKTINEICYCTNRQGDTLTVSRGQEQTLARGWNGGDIVANLVTAGTLANFVQQGIGPAATSMIYVGSDVSSTVNLIVANTNPVPASFVPGMQFNIHVANTNTGSVYAQLNGSASIQVMRSDGSAMVGGDIYAGEELIIVYNGVHFTSTVPPIPQRPPQTVFYVRTDGNDANTGFANDPADAFQTIQGAMNAIKSRYISENTLTIRVNPGTYYNGFTESSSYIAAWYIVGDINNPGNVVLNCTSQNTNSFINGSPPGRCAIVGGTGNLTVQGFTFESYLENAAAVSGGYMSISYCYFSSPVSGIVAPVGALSGATLAIGGPNQYTGYNPTFALIAAAEGAVVLVGYRDFYNSNYFTMQVNGNPTFGTATACGFDGGVIEFYSDAVAFTGGTPQCAAYLAANAGGIIFTTPNVGCVPGSSPGVVQNPGWMSHG